MINKGKKLRINKPETYYKAMVIAVIGLAPEHLAGEQS